MEEQNLLFDIKKVKKIGFFIENILYSRLIKDSNVPKPWLLHNNYVNLFANL